MGNPYDKKAQRNPCSVSFALGLVLHPRVGRTRGNRLFYPRGIASLGVDGRIL